MKYIYSEIEIYENTKRLNMLQDRNFEWRQVKSRKKHIDEFGIEISANEYYYKRELGSVYNSMKLSRKSMDTFLHILFNGNTGLQSITNKLVEKERQEYVKIVNELLPRSKAKD